MKVVIKAAPADSPFKPGDVAELKGEELDVLSEAGHQFVPHEAYEAELKARQAAEALIVRAVDRAVARGALVPHGDGVNSAEKVKEEAISQVMNGADAQFIAELIEGLQPVGTDGSAGGGRLTPSPTAAEGLVVTGTDLRDATKGYIQAMAPVSDLCRNNQWTEAARQAREACVILKKHHLKASDALLTELVPGATRFDPRVIHAATFNDPNNQVGALAADLIILRNLGYLVYKLNWLPYFTTDLSGEPVRFGQSILTRYITPPGVLTWVPGVGFTSDAGTIAAAGAGETQAGATTQATGTVTKSIPNVTDRSVTLNKFKGTEIEFPISLLGGTVRNLFAEQYGAQTYSLAEEINKDVLSGIFKATWTGIKTTYTRALANWDLASLIGLKNALTIAKVPDVGRFVLMHSFYHDRLLEDTNLLTAKAILSLIKQDAGAFETGELPVLFGLRPLESQLASAKADGTLTLWTDDTNPGDTVIVGFAGNMSSYLFVSRPPQDWTTVLGQLGIPLTASVRLVTEPDSGLTVMVFSYADNGKMSISQRVCLMWGHAQGDPRIGIVLKNS